MNLSSPNSGALLGNSVLFAASDGAHTAEVWKSDGTAAGTSLVAVPPDNGQGNSPYAQPTAFTAAGGKVFFDYDDGIHGNELWVTDGINAGTKMVTDYVPGSASSYPTNFNVVGNKLVYTAVSQVNGYASTLFATDSTATGTVAIADIGTNLSPGFVMSGGNLYFSAHSAIPGTMYGVTSESWVSDGTKAGTHVAVTLPGNLDGYTYSSLNWLTTVGSKIFFAGNDGTPGRELWVADGTTTGTKLVKDINTVVPPGQDPSAMQPGSMPSN